MRFVYFDFNNNYGGGPHTAVNLAKWLNRINEVHIIDAYGRCEQYLNAINEAGLPCHVLLPESKMTYIGNLGKPIARMISLLKQLPDLFTLRSRLVKKIIELDPDVIWVSGGKSLFFLASSLRLRHFPVVAYPQTWCLPEQVSFHYRWLLKHWTAAVMAISTATAANLEQLGIPSYKLQVVANAMDIESIEQEANKPLESPVPGIDMSPRILLSAARPELKKGHMTAVKALARLKEKGYHPALWFPGKTAVGADSTFTDKLKKTINKLGVQDNVFFLGWRQDMPALINACDIVILPSHTEGLPRVIQESMLLRRPVVTTPVGGICDIITDGKTGLVFSVDDDAALADQIQKVITNPEETAKIVEQAFKFAKENFSPDLFVERVMGIFLSAVKSKKD
jgi:glycosyltransferase involved in cell wall biosynthesis